MKKLELNSLNAKKNEEKKTPINLPFMKIIHKRI